jgi:Flp pilus assembly protein TadD
MMTKTVFKIAASSLVLGLTMVGCKPATDMARPSTLSSKAPKADRDAGKVFEQAHLAAQQNNLAAALSLAERAVELSPRDAGYRMLLADLYLKNGRFLSAEAAFADVTTLDPGNHRATLRGALAQIAQGKQMAALVKLDRLVETASPADVGLAFALAGQPRRAIQLLEPAARAAGATALIRQNLALSYALAGDWQKARITAAQDVAPGELDSRLQQWAALAKPASSYDQVAAMFNVRPVADAGQPTRLALAPLPQAEPVALAALEAAPEPALEATPATYAAADVEVPLITVDPAPSTAFDFESAPTAPAVETYADAVQSLVDPVTPAATQAVAAVAAAPIRPFTTAKPRRASIEGAPRITGAGRFAVQLGAFRTAEQVEKAWAQVHRRYSFARQPLSTMVKIPGKGTFHRLAIAGFASHDEASRRCTTIRAKGGACFVRATAGDAPVQWAARYSRRA